MAKVLMEKLNKHYGDVKAVIDLDLEIPDKEFVVLVGPSGCGKTTTLRMVAGLEEITAGDIYIDDKLVNQLPPKDRDIAMVFQNYALYPHMTVYQNLAFALTLRKISKAEIDRRVKDAAEILNIGELLQRKPKALSGGQRQRVAVGRAIVRKPKVFLFDEPLSNLDAKLRVQMRAELKKLHERLQGTVIYVTHDQVEAMTMGDRIVVMKDGLKQQVGPPLGLYFKPANKFVAGFIGGGRVIFSGSGDEVEGAEGQGGDFEEIQQEAGDLWDSSGGFAGGGLCVAWGDGRGGGGGDGASRVRCVFGREDWGEEFDCPNGADDAGEAACHDLSSAVAGEHAVF
jgi:multiple sugar transport system ATP-binding protein